MPIKPTMSLLDVSHWSLGAISALFIAAAAVIAVAGTYITRIADRLADVTGLGEALFGALLLGATTSLPGIVTSVIAAYRGYPELAVSNAVGGIAAQTAFLAIADMGHRGINLEHAAASVENMIQGALLVTLLALPVLALTGPELAPFGVHPASLALLAGYWFGIRLVAAAKAQPLWQPRRTPETLDDKTPQPDDEHDRPLYLWLRFIPLGATVAVAGYIVAVSGIGIADRTGLSQSVVGTLFTAIATSLPELVTSIAAVRQGALTLAVGGIIGGNCFDVLFIAFADVAYRDGSIYHAITYRQTFTIALTQLLTGILLLGLLRREKRGIGNIGFESVLVLALYLGAMLVLALG